MEITMIALLAVLVLAALSGRTEGLDHTYVSNGSSRQTVVATTSYEYGTGISQFVNRVIVPGDSQADQYFSTRDKITLEIWVLDGCCHSILKLTSDESVVVTDSTDPQVQQDGGVDVFQAIYKTQFQPEGEPLATIYPGVGLCDYTTWSCCSISGNPCSY